MTTTPAPALRDLTESQRAAALDTIHDEAVQNPRAAELREQAIQELVESIGPQTLPGELRAIHAAVDRIRRAASPKPQSPFFRDLQKQ